MPSFLVIKVPMPDDHLYSFLADEIAKSNMECCISRELTGDDTTYENMLFIEEGDS